MEQSEHTGHAVGLGYNRRVYVVGSFGVNW